MALVDIGELVQIVATLYSQGAGAALTRSAGAPTITIYDSAGAVVVPAAPMLLLAAGVGCYGYSWDTTGRAAGVYTWLCLGAALTDIMEPASGHLELRAQDIVDAYTDIKADVAVVEADVTYGNNNTDTLITRVPGEVAQKAHLVAGAGDITPPANTGIWDILEDVASWVYDPDDIYLAMVKQAPGASACILTVNDGVGALANVDVWLTSDLAGAVVVAGPLVTDVLGHATFYLDNATYYVWMQKIGYTQPTPPGTWIVVGATNKTLSLTSTGAVPTATYCTYQDVADFMQLAFGAGGKPTATEVDKMIVMAEDKVDNDLSHPDRMKSWKAHAETDLYLDYDGGERLDLMRADVGVITGSKLYYFNGTDFTDYVEEGDTEDFYVDREIGVIHFPQGFGGGSSIPAFWDTRMKKNVKLSFAWGAATVPKYVKLATILATAMFIASNDDYADVFTTANGRIAALTKLQQYERLYKELVENHREVR